MTYYDKYRYLTTLGAAEDGDNWWVAGYQGNGIFSVNKENNTIHFLKRTENEHTSLNAFKDSFMYRGRIYFLPWWSYSIEIYDVELEKFYVVKIPDEASKFYGAVGYIVDEEYIYIFSRFCNETPIRLNIDTLVCERIWATWTDISKKYSRHDKYFINSITEVNGNFWYGVYQANVLIKSSKKDLRDTQPIILDANYRIHQVAYIGKNCLLVTMADDEECIVYNVEDEVIEYTVPIKTIGRVINIINDEEEIILIPRHGKRLLLVNRDSGASRLIDCDNERMRCFTDNDEYFYYGKMNEEKIYLFPYNTNMLVTINRKDMSVSYEEWEIEKGASTEEIMRKYVVEYNRAVLDERRCSMDIFLNDMVTDGHQGIRCEDVGGRVHEEVRKRV